MFGLGRSTTVATADLEFRALTGQAEIDVKAFGNVVTNEVNSVDRTLRASSLAWEKYHRTMAQVAPDSYQARRALVTLERELEQIRREADRTAASQKRLQHHASLTSTELTKTGRGAIAASGAFKGLGNALFFASGAFAGAFGIVYALRSTFDAAKRAQVAIVGLQKAVHNSGLSWEENRTHILNTLEAQSKLTAFDDEELKNSLAGFIIRTKDVNEALRLNQLAADIARARHIDLDAAMRLVTRASLGQTSSLRRLGIDVQKVTTEQDKLRAAGVKVTFQQRQQAKAADEAATKLAVVTQLEAKFGGQAAIFAKTAAGRQEYFNKVLEDTKEIIGIALLPTFNRLLTHFTEWLDKLNKSGDLQRNVNEDLREAGEIFHGLEAAVRDAKDVLGPFVDLMGGTHDAVKKVLELYAIYKVARIATSVKAIATAWGLVGPAATAAAAETVAAEGAIGTGALTAAGKVRGLGLTLGGLAFAVGVAGALAVGERSAAPSIRGQQDLRSYPHLFRVFKKIMAKQPLTPQESAAWKIATAGNLVTPNGRTNASKAQLQQGESMLAGTAFPGAPVVPGSHPGQGGQPTKPPPTKPGTTPGGAGGKPPRTEIDIQLDIARAQDRGDEAAEIRYHRELIAFYQRQVNRLEAIKNKTLLQKQKLLQLRNEIDSERAAVEGIVSGQQTAARAAAAKKAAAAREAHAREKARIDTQAQKLENALLRAVAKEGTKDDEAAAKALIAFYKKAARNKELTEKERQQYMHKALTVRAREKAALAKATETQLAIKEKKLQNAVDAAALKDGIKDDEKALKALIAFYKAEEHNRALSQKARLEARRKEIAARKKLKKLKDDDTKKGGTQSGAEFLASLQGTLNTYGGNLFAPGELRVGGRAHDKAATAHTIIQTDLLRKQNKHLRVLTKQIRHPASRAGYTNITSLYDGYAT